MSNKKSKQELLHNLSSDDNDNKPALKKSKLIHHKLLPIRLIDDAAKQRLNEIIKDVNSMYNLMGLAKVYLAVAMHKLFQWIDEYYGRGAQKRWFNLFANDYGINFSINHARKYAKFGDPASSAFLTQCYEQSQHQISLNMNNCEEIIKRWKQNENASVKQIVSDLLNDNEKKKKKLSSDKLKERKAALLPIYRSTIKRIKTEKDEDKKNKLKEKAKAIAAKLNALDQSVDDGNNNNSKQNTSNTITIISTDDDDDDIDNNNDNDDDSKQEVRKTSSSKATNDNMDDLEANMMSFDDYYLGSLDDDGDNAQDEAESNDNHGNDAKFDRDRVILYIERLKHERDEIDKIIFDLEQQLKQTENMDIDDITDDVDKLNLND